MDASNQKIRVDKWIKARYPSLSRQLIREALEAKLVTSLSGKRLKKGERLTMDSQLEAKPLETHLKKLQKTPPNFELTIVEETPNYWVVDKPGGIPSHPVHLKDTQTLTQWAFHKDSKLKEEFKEIQPTLCPHRLDTDTSGLLLLAKNKATFGEFRNLFNEHQVSKIYLAMCWGSPKEDLFVIDWPIGHHPTYRNKMVSLTQFDTPVRSPIQSAKSQVEVLKRKEGMFLAQILSTTGVTHQVRVHLSAEGFALLGDKLYDEKYFSRQVQPQFHQLRCIQLSSDSFNYKLSPDSFISQFDSL